MRTTELQTQNVSMIKNLLKEMNKANWNKVTEQKPMPPIKLPNKETTFFQDLVNYGIPEQKAFELIRDNDLFDLQKKVIEYQNFQRETKKNGQKVLSFSLLDYLEGKENKNMKVAS